MSKELIDALNKDLADELAAITQYMWHHVMVEGIDSPSVAGIFRQTALDEMGHAELLAERITHLGGVPTKQPSEIKMGGDMRKMIQDDLDGEIGAIAQYKEHIKLASGDPGTRRMLEDILMDEERHADTWKSILSK